MIFFIIIIILLLIWGINELIFWITHRNPLTEEEIIKLSKKRTERYVQSNYNFKHYTVAANKQFKSSMNTKGELYKIDESLDLFPSLASALLKNKKHEWVILAIATEDKIKFMWTNKGVDNQSVIFSCSLGMMIDMCKNADACALMRFHNHPNGIIATSEQDLISARLCSEQVNKAGINWLDFVCGTGNFLLYHKSVSSGFCPNRAKIELIKKENSQSKESNYKLHRELR